MDCFLGTIEADNACLTTFLEKFEAQSEKINSNNENSRIAQSQVEEFDLQVRKLKDLANKNNDSLTATYVLFSELLAEIDNEESGEVKKEARVEQVWHDDVEDKPDRIELFFPYENGEKCRKNSQKSIEVNLENGVDEKEFDFRENNNEN